jgi:hypothetical protein
MARVSVLDNSIRSNLNMKSSEIITLGPANDTPEVLVEVRAAEIAAGVDVETGHTALMAEDEMGGWVMWHGGFHYPGTSSKDWAPISGGAQAGWLAREIIG